MIHDIEYLKGNQWKADNNMWMNLMRESKLNLPLANATRAAFLIKDLIGYDTPISNQKYKYAKKLAIEKYNLGKMKFYDGSL